MTYFGFLLRFLVIPIALLAGFALLDRRRGKRLPAELRAHSPWRALLVLVVVAVLYTTPWDNYLVATGVWWYDPDLVTGIVLGWVPLEEYTFFVLETVLAGLWMLALACSLPVSREPAPDRPIVRQRAVLAITPLWIWALIVLALDWDPGIYLALLLAWALPPVALQLAFGADLLWHFRRLVLLATLAPAVYLSLADALAIDAGTWTINPAQSLNWFLGGVLPVEEAAFFLVTNTLIVFGLTLALSVTGKERLKKYLRFLPETALSLHCGRPNTSRREEFYK